MRARTGLVGAALGVVAVGAAAGLAAERYAIGRTRLRPDPDAHEPFFGLPADRTRRVVADDGVPLHVEEVGPPDADVTVVFVHGYVQEMAVWHYQRRALAADGQVRLVFYDQRSHGRSGRGRPETATIDQLGRDLHRVLQEVVPTGPVVLVGHSMGGMTIMALADVTFGLPGLVRPVSRRVMPFLTRGVRARPKPFERGRRVGTDLAFLVTRFGGFGDRDVSPSLVQFVETMLARTPVDVIAEFYDTFTSHDKLAAIQVLRDVETLVLVGSKDLVTPVDHSRAIADALPDAQLVVVEGAGHMVALERPALVTLQLRALIARATRTAARSA